MPQHSAGQSFPSFVTAFGRLQKKEKKSRSWEYTKWPSLFSEQLEISWLHFAHGQQFPTLRQWNILIAFYSWATVSNFENVRACWRFMSAKQQNKVGFQILPKRKKDTKKLTSSPVTLYSTRANIYPWDSNIVMKYTNAHTFVHL